MDKRKFKLTPRLKTNIKPPQPFIISKEGKFPEILTLIIIFVLSLIFALITVYLLI